MRRWNGIIGMLLCGCMMLNIFCCETGEETVNAAQAAAASSANKQNQAQDDLFSTGLELIPWDNGGREYGSWWRESELCAYIENIPVGISRGGYGASVYIQDYALKDGSYAVEMSLCTEKSPYSYFALTGGSFVIRNGLLDEGSSECNWRRIPTGYLVDMVDCYYQKEILEDYVVIFKLHSDTTGENGSVYFGGLFLADAVSGLTCVDLNDSSLKISAERLAENKAIDTKRKTFVSGMEVTNITGMLYTGETLKLNVKTAGSKKELTCTSSNKAVAAVSKSGKITAKKAGTTRITVRDSISGAELSWLLTVSNPYIAPAVEKNAVRLGNTYRFTGVGYGVENTKFTWSSSDKSVGAIGKTSGLFRALKEGTTKITLKDQNSNKRYSFTVKVYDVTKRDLDKYISIETNGLLPAKLEQEVTELLYTVYPDVFDYFADGVYNKITCIFEQMDGVAYTAGRDIHVNSDYLNSHPWDLDCITHELIHCAQYYAVYDDAWLIEGITDYGRSLFGIYNDKAGWQLASYSGGQSYTDGYQVTGGFLRYIAQNHNKDIVLILNNYLKKGSCPDRVWVESTGYTIDELWELYAAR